MKYILTCEGGTMKITFLCQQIHSAANIVSRGKLLSWIWSLVPLSLQRRGFRANGENDQVDNGQDDGDDIDDEDDDNPLQVEFIATLSADLTSACPRGCSGIV